MIESINNCSISRHNYFWKAHRSLDIKEKNPRRPSAPEWKSSEGGSSEAGSLAKGGVEIELLFPLLIVRDFLMFSKMLYDNIAFLRRRA